MTKAIEKLRQQEQAAATEVCAKVAEHTAAQEAVTKAATAYDSAGDASGEKTWLKSKEAEQLAGLRMESAKRKHTAAKQQRSDAERAELELKRDELAAKVSRVAIIAAGAELAHSEARARRAVVDIVGQRLALADSFRTIQRELNAVLVQLGEPTVTTDEAEYAASPMPVRDNLQTDIATLLQTDRQLAELLRELLPVKY
ncbi:MAG TPA: hypothetical protein VHW01_05255 [Polyangiaceae bacterium]|nr:hypothetical protein [Polyangiaceae bacterium]